MHKHTHLRIFHFSFRGFCTHLRIFHFSFRGFCPWVLSLLVDPLLAVIVTSKWENANQRGEPSKQQLGALLALPRILRRQAENQ
jgi:hypothetical protein